MPPGANVCPACPANVIVWLALLIVTSTFCIPVPPALVAETVTMNVPVTIGVPEIAPVIGLSVKLAPSGAAPKLNGELVAVI